MRICSSLVNRLQLTADNHTALMLTRIGKYPVGGSGCFLDLFYVVSPKPLVLKPMNAYTLIAVDNKKTRKAFSRAGLLTSLRGGRYWVRTSDPCRVKAVLYH